MKYLFIISILFLSSCGATNKSQRLERKKEKHKTSVEAEISAVSSTTITETIDTVVTTTADTASVSFITPITGVPEIDTAWKTQLTDAGAIELRIDHRITAAGYEIRTQAIKKSEDIVVHGEKKTITNTDYKAEIKTQTVDQQDHVLNEKDIKKFRIQIWWIVFGFLILLIILILYAMKKYSI